MAFVTFRRDTAMDASIWRRTRRGTLLPAEAAAGLDDRVLAGVLADMDVATGVSGVVSVQDVADRVRQMIRNRNQLRVLLRDTGIAQRTPEWYVARQDLVTASDIAQCLGHAKFADATPLSFFVKKVPVAKAQEVAPSPSPSPEASGLRRQLADPDPEVIAPLKWGTMYEDVAVKLYESRNDVAVREFGLLRHADPDVPLGASPDGITDAGVMLEIKCPFRRTITGEVPLQYYYQIQGQLEVCNLDCCDFLECAFSEYADEEAFFRDRLFHARESGSGVDEGDVGCVGSNGRETGAIAEFVEPDDGGTGTRFAYEYLDVLCPSRACVARWKRDVLSRDGNRRFKTFRFWRLETYSVVRVVRDGGFVRTMLDGIRQVWARVLQFRREPQAFREYLESASAKPKPRRGGVVRSGALLSLSPPPPPPASGYAFVSTGDSSDDDDGKT